MRVVLTILLLRCWSSRSKRYIPGKASTTNGFIRGLDIGP
ncbi:hypothetical protein GEV33_000429 [Tenebrio molitor]|uniref:Uncharacterized protein n=1 Tax=Tenebrio molitor TaxID=7067 RepID=A0A8J6HXI7_TENMO|nr:hypothetical protein GEV33_000429 [Tenebrio molitor]